MSIPPTRTEIGSEDLRASLRIREHLMIIHQMLLVPRILLHLLVVVYALENDLAEAVKVGEVAHLRVEEFGHQGAGGALVVNLCIFSISVQPCWSHHGYSSPVSISWYHTLSWDPWSWERRYWPYDYGSLLRSFLASGNRKWWGKDTSSWLTREPTQGPRSCPWLSLTAKELRFWWRLSWRLANECSAREMGVITAGYQRTGSVEKSEIFRDIAGLIISTSPISSG